MIPAIWQSPLTRGCVTGAGTQREVRAVLPFSYRTSEEVRMERRFGRTFARRHEECSTARATTSMQGGRPQVPRENAIAPGAEVAEVDDVIDDRDDTIVDIIADAFGREEVGEPLRSRLLREGYIHLDASGLFASDRFVLAEQVSGLNAEGVQLNVTATR